MISWCRTLDMNIYFAHPYPCQPFFFLSTISIHVNQCLTQPPSTIPFPVNHPGFVWNAVSWRNSDLGSSLLSCEMSFNALFYKVEDPAVLGVHRYNCCYLWLYFWTWSLPCPPLPCTRLWVISGSFHKHKSTSYFLGISELSFLVLTHQLHHGRPFGIDKFSNWLIYKQSLEKAD